MQSYSIFVDPRPKLAQGIEAAISSGELTPSTLHLRAGDYLFRSNDNVSSTYYLARGLIRLSSTSASGDTKTVFLHRAGSLIGFQTLQRSSDKTYPSILDAQATAASEIRVLDAVQFRDFLIRHGDLCFEMTCYLFDLLANQTKENVNGSIYPVLNRFAALLLMLAREMGLSLAPAVVPFTNTELANMLGVHTNSITNAISSLRRVECVDRQHGFLVITDFRKLKQIAGDLIADDHDNRGDRDSASR
jgi:CRP/FNR family cyclic AMP-dependent transcriptional regulator